MRMALVSGRPISFQMDLYTPLFVPRPTVELELFASLRPPTYNGNLAFGAKPGFDALNAPAPMPAPEADRGAFAAEKQSDGRGGRRGEGKGGQKEAYREQMQRQLGERLDLGGSVNAAASAAKLGDFFQYAIDRPVSLARQKSALLPIVTKEVDASRVSIYNERTQAKFPCWDLNSRTPPVCI